MSAKLFIFFPPRLIETDPSLGDHNVVLDAAKEAYFTDGIVILSDEQSIKDCHKIVHFHRSFPDLLPPS